MTMSMVKSIFRDPPKMKTERLILRRIKRCDAFDMYNYAADPEVSRYLLWSPHPDMSYTERYIGYLDEQYRDGEFYDWAVICERDRKMIGTAGFTRFDYQNNSAEVGYVLSRDYWGFGYAPEALAAVMHFGFIELNLHRIEARYMDANSRSRRVMEKCGMKFEGIHKDMLFVKNNYRSIGVCAILSDEYYINNPDID